MKTRSSLITKREPSGHRASVQVMSLGGDVAAVRGSDEDGVWVLFEVEKVRLIPFLRRGARGFLVERGRGLLSALTPLHLRCFARDGGSEKWVIRDGDFRS